MKKDVRILLVGDAGVGKTSLILSLVSEEFPEEVPPRAEEITIPADVTPEKVPTHIVDYSSLEQTEGQLDEAILKANVICVVYDVTQEETINRITSYWLPRITEVYGDIEKPIILVGNKSDLSDETTIETVLPIMNEYTEVETCVECSAKSLKNISETFYYAQKAVLHPTAPLYSPEGKELKPACVNALTRIFKICDVDNDGILSDTELNEFQCRCFKAPLQPQGLSEVKNVVMRNLPDNGIINDGLSIHGFLFLHKLFIQRGRHETTWTALRKFGYGEDLRLRKDYICPGIEVGSDCTTELTDQGYEFLIDLFSRHDKDGDEALCPEEMNSLFSMCPSVPWDDTGLASAKRNEYGWITLEGFLAQWALNTYLDYQRTLEYLAYFGYTHGQNEYPLTSAITVTRSKAMDLQKKQTARTVFHCLVVGAKGVGKTRFLQSFIGTNTEELDPDTELPTFTINLVTVHRQEKYLVLHEVDWFNVEDVLEQGQCDVVCFLFDSTDPHSFARVIKLHELLPDRIPVLFASTKNDLVPVKQECAISPAEYCSLHNIPPPQTMSISATSNSSSGNKHIFTKLATMAVYPSLCGSSSSYGLMPSSWVAVGLGAAVVLAACFVAYRYSHNTNS